MSGISTTWLLLRATGLVAMAVLTLAVVTGLLGPALRRPGPRLVSVTVHRATATTGLALTLGHVVLGVADSWVDVPPRAAIVPGASHWEPFWIGLGTLAVDLLIVVALSSALRGRGPRIWWRLHVLTYPAWALAVGHALVVGTDVAASRFRAAALVGVVLVGASALARLVVRWRGRPVGVPATTSAPLEAR